MCSNFNIFLKSLVIFTCYITFITLVSCQIQNGDTCKKNDGSPGICQPLKFCPQEQADLIQKKILPKVCIHVPETLICCQTNVSSSTTTTTIKPIKECDYPDHAVTVERDEYHYKSWNKCIDLADSVFPCQSLGFGLNAQKARFSTCQQEATELITGGKKARVNEFPHMAALGYENKKESIIEWHCGGTLVSEQWVMSAAHCKFYGNLMANVSHVRLGGGNLNIPAASKFMFTITEHILHPDYDGISTYNDILLLKLDRIIKYSMEIRPACLHVGNFVDDNKVIAIGYGRTDEYDINSKSDILLKVVLNKFTHEKCSEKFPIRNRRHPNGVVNATQVCYGSFQDNKDTCAGDSGGPVQIYNRGVHCTYIVTGITSTGRKCGRSGVPALYTRVSAFLPWIESIVWPN